MGKHLENILYGIDPSKKLLYSKWAIPIESPMYKEGMQHLAQEIMDKGIERWIHESSLLNNLTLEDQQWLTDALALILTQSQLKYIALIRPQNAGSNKISYTLRDRAFRIYGKKVGIEFFDTLEEAKAWILPNLQHYRLPAISSPVNQH